MIYFFRVEYKSYYSIEVSDLLCPLSGAYAFGFISKRSRNHHEQTICKKAIGSVF